MKSLLKVIKFSLSLCFCSYECLYVVVLKHPSNATAGAEIVLYQIQKWVHLPFSINRICLWVYLSKRESAHVCLYIVYGCVCLREREVDCVCVPTYVHWGIVHAYECICVFVHMNIALYICKPVCHMTVCQSFWCVYVYQSVSHSRTFKISDNPDTAFSVVGKVLHVRQTFLH